MMQTLERLGELALVPVIEIEQAEHAAPLAPAKLISAGAFDEITRLTREAVAIVRQQRGGGR